MNDKAPVDSANKDALTFGVIAGAVSLFVFWMWQRADNNNLSASEARQIIDSGNSPPRWWFVDHPFVAALIVFAVVTIGFRLYLLMRRLEDRR